MQPNYTSTGEINSKVSVNQGDEIREKQFEEVLCSIKERQANHGSMCQLDRKSLTRAGGPEGTHHFKDTQNYST